MIRKTETLLDVRFSLLAGSFWGNWLLILSGGCIHLIDFPMQRPPADTEFFSRGGHVSIRRGECLRDQSSFRLVQIERT